MIVHDYIILKIYYVPTLKHEEIEKAEEEEEEEK